MQGVDHKFPALRGHHRLKGRDSRALGQMVAAQHIENCRDIGIGDILPAVRNRGSIRPPAPASWRL